MGLPRLQLAGLVLAGVAGIAAQTQVSLVPRARSSTVAPLPPSNFRVDARMVQIPVTVTDALDRNVMSLAPEHFRVFEGGVEQKISALSMTDAPISAGIVFDTSGSMKTRIQESRAAVQQFMDSSVAGDQFFMVHFADTASLLTPFTTQPGHILGDLEKLVPRGWTALYDAVFLSVQQMRRASNPRRALLILSDGDDNNSRYTESEVLSLVREADVRVYAIGLFTKARCLEKMTAETGGRMIVVHNLTELPAAMEKLSLEMRNLYMLGYFSTNSNNDGRYRKVQVEVHPPNAQPVHISWRRGYVDPIQ